MMEQTNMIKEMIERTQEDLNGVNEQLANVKEVTMKDYLEGQKNALETTIGRLKMMLER